MSCPCHAPREQFPGAGAGEPGFFLVEALGVVGGGRECSPYFVSSIRTIEIVKSVLSSVMLKQNCQISMASEFFLHHPPYTSR